MFFNQNGTFYIFHLLAHAFFVILFYMVLVSSNFLLPYFQFQGSVF